MLAIPSTGSDLRRRRRPAVRRARRSPRAKASPARRRRLPPRGRTRGRRGPRAAGSRCRDPAREMRGAVRPASCSASAMATKGAHVLGEMREAAVGQAVADRRGRPAGAGQSMRMAPCREPRGRRRVAAHRRVALQVEQFGVVRASWRSECVHGDETLEARVPTRRAPCSVTRRACRRRSSSSSRNQSALAGSQSSACSGHSTMAIPSCSASSNPSSVELVRGATADKDRNAPPACAVSHSSAPA